jgi:uncharacterized protein
MPTHDEHIDICVDSDRIAGTVVTPGTLVPGVLFVHGWGGSQEQYLARARDIAALGCVCLAFDLRGHAATKVQYETVSREKNLRDVLAAYDLLAARRHVDPSAIAVIGSSYGGYLAAILTSMRPVKWLGLRAPALYIDTGWDSPKLQLHIDQDLKAYRHSFVPAEKNRALQACQDFEGDVLLIQSELDDIVPQAVLSSYRKACLHARSLTYRCLEGADHGLTGEGDHKNYANVLVGWMAEMVRGARSTKTVISQTEAPKVQPESPPQTI